MGGALRASGGLNCSELGVLSVPHVQMRATRLMPGVHCNLVPGSVTFGPSCSRQPHSNATYLLLAE